MYLGREYDFFALVNCITYNHAPFIEQTMDGFCAQKTSFPYLCVIMDDASIDGEQDVIKGYLNSHFDLDKDRGAKTLVTDDYVMTFARHSSNKNCFFAVFLLKYNHYRKKKDKMQYIVEWLSGIKYIALCEGDDYWTDENKLDNQVRFLEEHTEYVFVYTNITVVDRNSKKVFVNHPNRYSGDCLKSLLIKGTYINTATVCYRSEADKDWLHYRSTIPFEIRMGDKVHFIYLAKVGLFKYMDKKTACYRLLENSASHFVDYKKAFEFVDNGEQLSLYLNKDLDIGVSEHVIKRNYAANRIRTALRYRDADYLVIAQKNISRYPSLLLRPKLMSLLFLRLFGGIVR